MHSSPRSSEFNNLGQDVAGHGVTHVSPYGANGTTFRVRAPDAEAVMLCLFDGEIETRLPMIREGTDWLLTVPAAVPGTRYGYRASGRFAPEQGRGIL